MSGSSQDAILSIIAFFIVGGLLLSLVDVAEGQRIGRAEEAGPAARAMDFGCGLSLRGPFSPVNHADRPGDTQVEYRVNQRDPRQRTAWSHRATFDSPCGKLQITQTKRKRPGYPQERRHAIKPAGLRRIEVARRHEGQEGQHDHDGQRNPRRPVGARKDRVPLRSRATGTPGKSRRRSWPAPGKSRKHSPGAAGRAMPPAQGEECRRARSRARAGRCSSRSRRCHPAAGRRSLGTTSLIRTRRARNPSVESTIVAAAINRNDQRNASAPPRTSKTAISPAATKPSAV